MSLRPSATDLKTSPSGQSSGNPQMTQYPSGQRPSYFSNRPDYFSDMQCESRMTTLEA